MGKLIVPLIISFLIGLSGGGFYSVYTTATAHGTAVATAQRTGLKADSAKVKLAAGDTSAHAAPVHDDTTTAAHASPSAPAGTVAAAAPITKPSSDASHAAPAATAASTMKPVVNAGAAVRAPLPGNAPPTAAESEAHQKRLAKIFATMGAKDAARVLGQMTDHDVSVILNLLRDRQAAAILINLPAPRAAVLSQMQPRRVGGVE